MIVLKEGVNSARSLKRTRFAIHKGYSSQILNMQLLLKKEQVNANIRSFSADSYPRFADQERRGENIFQLASMTIASIASQQIERSKLNLQGTSSTDPVGTDIDFDDSMLEISDVKDKLQPSMNIEQIATSAFIDVCSIYQNNPFFTGKKARWYGKSKEFSVTLGSGLTTLDKCFVPVDYNNNVQPVPLHSVFSTIFTPKRHGVLYVMEMNVLLFFNEAEIGKVRVAQREVSEFRWDRNPYYISGATGTILKSIFSHSLGKKIESF